MSDTGPVTLPFKCAFEASFAVLCVRQLVFWLLVVSSFNNIKMHVWSPSMLLLLHSTFVLSMVKMLLKGEVGGHALNSHGNYIL